MIISITGTPGTGKNTVSKLVAKKLGWEAIDLNKLAKEKNLFIGFDEKRKCDIVDIKKLNLEIKKLKKDAIIQSHYSHELNSDIVIVLRTNPAELRKRLEKRGWPKEKIEENVEAEIMEICKSDALNKTNKVFEVDTTKRKPTECAEEATDIIFREGFDLKKDLKIPEKLLQYFKKPYGKVFGSAEDFVKSGVRKKDRGLLIIVGDQSSYTLLKSGADPDIIVIDSKVRRELFKKKIEFAAKEFEVINRPGITTRNFWETIKKAITQAKIEKVKVIVMGEDDLGVLPSIIMAPVGSIVLYGQPELDFEGDQIKEGLVAIEINIEKKKDALKLLEKMQKLQ